nr:twin-arginine translocation signal domain-containing protein [Rhodopirellula sp. SM50]
MNRTTKHDDSRRGFLKGSACGATALAVAGMAGATESAGATETVQPTPREVKRVPIHCPSPRRIAAAADQTVFVATGNSVQRVDPDGKVLWQSQFPRPVRCLCVDRQDLFVGVRDRVIRFDFPAGDSQPLPSLGVGCLVGDIVKQGGRLMATDVAASRLLQLELDSAERNWRGVENVDSPIHAAGRIASSSRGGLAITDPARHRVVMTDQRGSRLGVWGKRSRQIDGFQGCCNPMATVELADGSWITAEAGQVRIKRFDSSGQFLQQLAGPDSIESPAVLDREDPDLKCGVGGIDLALSSDNHLWVLHAAARELILYRMT